MNEIETTQIWQTHNIQIEKRKKLKSQWKSKNKTDKTFKEKNY